MFFFQYYSQYICQHAPYSSGTGSIHYTYIDRIAHDGLPILDNKPKLRVIASERQRLRANTSPNIDNQRAFWKVFPAVPCKNRRFKGEMMA